MNSNSKPISEIKILKYIHLGMVFGGSIFGIILLNINGVRILDMPNINEPFIYISIGASVLGYFLGRMFFVQKLKLAKKQKEKPQKLGVLFTGYLIRYALLEFPALINFVFYMITENAFFFIIGFVVILIMVMLRPNKAQIHNWLKVML